MPAVLLSIELVWMSFQLWSGSYQEQHGWAELVHGQSIVSIWLLSQQGSILLAGLPLCLNSKLQQRLTHLQQMTVIVALKGLG